MEQRGDPVKGTFAYDPEKDWILFTDASNDAYGAILIIGGVVVQDFCSLRKKHDLRHINEAELQATIHGLELVNGYVQTLKRKNQTITAVYEWLNSKVSGECRPIKGMSKTLIERKRLTFFDTVEVMGITVKMELVPSEKNPADELSRIPKELKVSRDELPDLDHQTTLLETEFEAVNCQMVCLAHQNLQNVETDKE